MFKETVIPFCGFYESKFSEALDHELEQYVDSLAEEYNIPAAGISDALFHDMDYRGAYVQIAKDFVRLFNDVFKERCGIDLGLEFKDLNSPREYNFGTDRIFCTIPLASVQALFGDARKNRFENFKTILKELFTRRSGFSPSYSNELEPWLTKRWNDYDHNEVYTLILAAMRHWWPGEENDFSDTILETMQCNGYFDTALGCGLDHAAFQEKITAMEKTDEESA